MTRPRPVIAIDGPAGVGKSTTARALAKRLGYTLVDTGALEPKACVARLATYLRSAVAPTAFEALRTD